MFRIFLGAFAALPILAAISAVTAANLKSTGTDVTGTCCQRCTIGCACCTDTTCVCDACQCGPDDCQAQAGSAALLAASTSPGGPAQSACCESGATCSVGATSATATTACQCDRCDHECEGCSDQCGDAGCECPLCSN